MKEIYLPIMAVDFVDVNHLRLFVFLLIPSSYQSYPDEQPVSILLLQ
jgi:hypothetical protein